MPVPDDAARAQKMPLPGWIVTFMVLCDVIAAALLVYAVASHSLAIGVLAVISLLCGAGFFRKFRRRHD
jgi:hypothetical protein